MAAKNWIPGPGPTAQPSLTPRPSAQSADRKLAALHRPRDLGEVPMLGRNVSDPEMMIEGKLTKNKGF